MAIPVNFTHLSLGIDANGTLNIRLNWQSDSGSLTDLNDCLFREYVTYDSLPCPAFFWQPPNPTYGREVLGNYGSTTDIHICPARMTPRQPGILIAHQHYQYRCPETNGEWVDVPGHHYRITRELSVWSRPGQNPQCTYRIEKRSLTLGGFRFEREFRVW
jgi:hypothetical protein